ncbi:MAG TPA: hypothetical protein DC034_10305 [Clostridium sp.]|nr:hypothetical protein [Clostridium sp.]
MNVLISCLSTFFVPYMIKVPLKCYNIRHEADMFVRSGFVCCMASGINFGLCILNCKLLIVLCINTINRSEFYGFEKSFKPGTV